MKEGEVEGVLQFTNFPNRKNSKLSLPQSNTRIHLPTTIDPFTEKIDLFVKAFEKVCLKLETNIELQNKKIMDMEDMLLASLVPRFDKLISVNQKICDGLQRNGSPSKDKETSFLEDRKVHRQSQLDRVSSLRQSIMSLDKMPSGENDNKTVGLSLPPLSTLEKPAATEISPIRKKTFSVEEMADKNKLNQSSNEFNLFTNRIMENAVVAFCNPLVSQTSQSEINKWVGSFYNQRTSHYFELYSKGNISYQDMKIKFSYDIINETLNLSTKWADYCKAKQGVNSKQKLILRRPEFYYMLNEASKNKLKFLISKYPPSRRKKVDTDISQKIKDTSKQFSIVKYDMLSHAKMDIGLDEKQTDFTKEIKMWLNKLVTETKTQFPIFKEKMRSIFVNPDESIELIKDINSQMQFVIGTKISQGTLLFTKEELDAPGLQLKSTQLLRILMKWCQQLSSYFVKHEQKIYGNSSGFKTVRGSLPIKIPKSRLDLLSANLKQIYKDEIVPCLEIQHNNIGQLVTDLISLATEGITNYQFLNQREISIVKLADYLNESLKAHVLNFLNLMLRKLVQIRSRYEDQKLQSNIHLITFGVMDILRCRCVGSKSQIYRIYKELLLNQEYFQVIRVKNKLNTPTRDIIINCKIKDSFLICEVQLSLGEAEEEVNDHFCHFLYELERTNFGVIFQCASQICSLDPRMQYVLQHKDIKFRGFSQKKALILQNIHQNPQQFVCQLNHTQTVMRSENNHQPFCCSLCTSFKPGFNLCLPYLKCFMCGTSICPQCIIMLGKNHAGFIQKYTSQDSKFQKFMKFFYPQHLYQNVQSSSQSLKQLEVQLLKFPYVLHIVVDNIGHKPTVYKRYKNTYIETFSTLKNVMSLSKTTPSSSWNYMVGMKPYERKLIRELKDYRKYSINMEWSDLEQILKEQNIQDVIVVIDEASKSALIVDVVESEDKIQICLTQRQVQKSISQVNRSGQNFLELTSKNLVDISLLNGIQKKKNIKVLNLWQNKIKNIQLLSQFKQVRELFLRENQVESIEAVLGMEKLQIAVVSSNKIRGSLPVLKLPHLSVLDISLNQFNDIYNISQSELKKLSFFKFVNIKIKEIPQMNFQNLETFWFDYNSVFNITNLSLSNLPKLAKVSGTHNVISGELPQLPFPLLQSLILNYNQIISLQKFSYSPCLSLKILSIHHNIISGSLPVFHLPALIKLDLSYNKISSLNYNQFNNQKLPSLENIDLKFNQIMGQFPIMNLKSLKKLDISNNLLSGIQNLGRSKLPSLEVLDLSKNHIKGSLCCLHLQKLRKLILSHNELSQIRNLSDSKLPKIQILKLNNNMIHSSIPKMYFENLRRIDLSSNFVSSQQFSKFIHLLPSLEKVFLINNPSSLKSSLFTMNPNLQSMVIFNQEYNE